MCGTSCTFQVEYVSYLGMAVAKIAHQATATATATSTINTRITHALQLSMYRVIQACGVPWDKSYIIVIPMLFFFCKEDSCCILCPPFSFLGMVSFFKKKRAIQDLAGILFFFFKKRILLLLLLCITVNLRYNESGVSIRTLRYKPTSVKARITTRVFELC